MYKVKYLCPKLDDFAIKNKILVNNIKSYVYLSYFVINYNYINKKKEIKVSFNTFNKVSKLKQKIVFIASNAIEISNLLLSHKMISLNMSSSHALYLGMELVKIEIALIMNQIYIQS